MMNVNQPVLNRSMQALTHTTAQEGYITKDEVARRLKKTTHGRDWQRASGGRVHGWQVNLYSVCRV